MDRLDIEISRHADDHVTVRASSAAGHASEAVTFAGDVVVKLERFTAGVFAAIESQREIDPETLALARQLHAQLLGGPTGELRATTLAGCAKLPLLERLLIVDTTHATFNLNRVPWEALNDPDTGYWGASPTTSLVRLVPVDGTVRLKDVRLQQEIGGAVGLLLVAALDDTRPAMIEAALRPLVDDGAVVLAERIAGAQASAKHLKEALEIRRGTHEVNIVHYIGHGTSEGGEPALQLNGGSVRAGDLAAELSRNFGRRLRLVVLECCKGAQPGTLASAGKSLTKQAADAVLAHLAEVRATVASMCSDTFYRVLAGPQGGGDVAAAANQARQQILIRCNQSAEAFSPVLYLRSTVHNPGIFDFHRRRLVPAKQPVAQVPAPAVDAQLVKILRGPFSLVLGDLWAEQLPIAAALRTTLGKSLADYPLPEGAQVAGLPLRVLTQYYSMRGGGDLYVEYKKQAKKLPQVEAVPRLARALAGRLAPGVHVTLLRAPVLEEAIREADPEDRTLVLQPRHWSGRSEAKAWMYDGGDWNSQDMRALSDPTRFLSDSRVVVRLFGGRLSEDHEVLPWLTEDDFVFGLHNLKRMFPDDLADKLSTLLEGRPALIVGMSLLQLHHRVLLYRLFAGQFLPRGSVVVLEPGGNEIELWKRMAWLPMAPPDDRPFTAIELEPGALADALTNGGIP